MSDKAWKKTERRVSRILRRGGYSEEQVHRITVAQDLQSGGSLDDVTHPIFQVQVKKRKGLKMLRTWFDGVAGHASRKRKVPLLVVKITDRSRLYAVLRLEDLVRLMALESLPEDDDDSVAD